MSAEWQRIQEADRVRRERARIERDLADIELRQNSTPQTLRKRKITVSDELFNRNKLTVEQLRAAREMERIVTEISRGLNARTSSFNQRVDTSHREDDWAPGLSRAYTERYIPWRDEAGCMAIREKATVADLTLDIVIGNLGLTQAAGLWGMHRHRVLGLLRASLYRYCEIAGWVRSPAAAELP